MIFDYRTKKPSVRGPINRKGQYANRILKTEKHVFKAAAKQFLSNAGLARNPYVLANPNTNCLQFGKTRFCNKRRNTANLYRVKPKWGNERFCQLYTYSRYFSEASYPSVLALLFTIAFHS
ncbi:MAG: hypothetical protein ACI9UJ_002415 [bacterium]|jgi:hypothetical protein